MGRAAVWVVAAVLTGLAACSKDTDTLDASAYDAVAAEAEARLNEPAAEILGLMRNAAGAPQVGWDALVITGEDGPAPVNWWLWNKGWIQLAGTQFAGRPVFALTEAGQAAAAADPDTPWFTATAGTDTPSVDCKSDAAITSGGCEVTMSVVPALTEAGRQVAGAHDFSPITVHALVAVGVEDWEIVSLSTEGPPLADQALEVILGPKSARAAALAAANDRLATAIMVQRAGPGGPEDGSAYRPPNYIETPPPVAAVGTESDPKQALGVGLPSAVTGR